LQPNGVGDTHCTYVCFGSSLDVFQQEFRVAGKNVYDLIQQEVANTNFAKRIHNIHLRKQKIEERMKKLNLPLNVY